MVNSSARAVFGVVTSGSLWKFPRLSGTAVLLDSVEYHIENPGKLLAILTSIVVAD